jgi:uncharacterized protein YdcH (DUF465 family)
MAKKNKALKKLIEEKEYLDRKVKEAEQDRGWDRSWDAKVILLRLKKQKLKIKEAISRFTDYFTSTN